MNDKYDMIPTEYKTAKEIGLHPSTLGAMMRRGLVETTDTCPKKYRRANGIAVKLYTLIEENKNDFDTYFTLRKKDKEIGMLCSYSNNKILDCWGKEYDLTDVNQIEFRTKTFTI